MAVQDKRLKNLVGRVTSLTREFPIKDPEGGEEDIPITLSRLLLTDMSKIDQELGVNLFASMTEAAQGPEGKGGIPREWDYNVQLEVFFRSLKKVESQINKSEAAEIVALLPAQEYWKAFAWIVFGEMRGAEEEIEKFQ